MKCAHFLCPILITPFCISIFISLRKCMDLYWYESETFCCTFKWYLEGVLFCVFNDYCKLFPYSMLEIDIQGNGLKIDRCDLMGRSIYMFLMLIMLATALCWLFNMVMLLFFWLKHFRLAWTIQMLNLFFALSGLGLYIGLSFWSDTCPVQINAYKWIVGELIYSDGFDDVIYCFMYSMAIALLMFAAPCISWICFPEVPIGRLFFGKNKKIGGKNASGTRESGAVMLETRPIGEQSFLSRISSAASFQPAISFMNRMSVASIPYQPKNYQDVEFDAEYAGFQQFARTVRETVINAQQNAIISLTEEKKVNKSVYFFLILNLIFLISGCTFIYFGIYLGDYYFFKLTGSPIHYLIMGTGAIVIIVVIIGCFGILKKNKKLIKIYLFTVLIMICCEFGVFSFVYSQQNETSLMMERIWNFTLTNDKKIDLENHFECCGLLVGGLTFPGDPCIQQPYIWYWNISCIGPLNELLESKFFTISASGITIGAIQVILLVLSGFVLWQKTAFSYHQAKIERATAQFEDVPLDYYGEEQPEYALGQPYYSAGGTKQKTYKTQGPAYAEPTQETFQRQDPSYAGPTQETFKTQGPAYQSQSLPPPAPIAPSIYQPPQNIPKKRASPSPPKTRKPSRERIGAMSTSSELSMMSAGGSSPNQIGQHIPMGNNMQSDLQEQMRAHIMQSPYGKSSTTTYDTHGTFATVPRTPVSRSRSKSPIKRAGSRSRSRHGSSKSRSKSPKRNYQ